MRIAEVIGVVTLNTIHPSVQGGRFPLAVPLTWDNLLHQGSRAEAIVVYDDSGAGIGCRVALSEGREAANPFEPNPKPIDAYNAAILDAVDVATPAQLNHSTGE
jgi:ethanolamine utilization protein EutN